MFILLDSVPLLVLDNVNDLVQIFYVPVNFIQEILCGTEIQNIDVFMSY